MDSILYTRIKQLCNEKGVSVNRLESELGFSTSTIQKWKTSSAPNSSSIIKIAQYFNVSTDYLLGVTDISSTADEFTSDDDIISLQRARSRMTQKDRDRMMQMLRIGFDYAFEGENNQSQTSIKTAALGRGVSTFRISEQEDKKAQKALDEIMNNREKHNK